MENSRKTQETKDGTFQASGTNSYKLSRLPDSDIRLVPEPNLYDGDQIAGAV